MSGSRHPQMPSNISCCLSSSEDEMADISRKRSSSSSLTSTSNFMLACGRNDFFQLGKLSSRPLNLQNFSTSKRASVDRAAAKVGSLQSTNYQILGHSVVKVGTGLNHTVVLTDGGQAFLTSKLTAKLIPVPGSENFFFVDAAVGKSHVLLLTNQGKVYAYGDNSYGQLGYTTSSETRQSLDHNEEWDSANYSSKLKSIKFDDSVGLAVSVSQIACGAYHNLALTITGEIYAWGRNNTGQLGVVSSTAVCASPVEILTIKGTPTRQIAAYWNSSYILSYSGDVYSFGDNSFGQCGVQSEGAALKSVTKITALTRQGVRRIIPGLMHCAAQTDTGRVWTWGTNRHGQLGHGSVSEGFEPPRYANELMGETILQVALGDKHTLVYSPKGVVYAFGDNSSGQLSIEDCDFQKNPAKVFLDSSEKVQIFAGHNQSFITSLPRMKAADQMDTDDQNRASPILGAIGNTAYTQIHPVHASLFNATPLKSIDGHRISWDSDRKYFGSSAIINSSFLARGHEGTNVKDVSGIDFAKLWSIYESWTGDEEKSKKSLDLVSNHLLPSLREKPPCIEAIRIYLILPMLPQFKLPSSKDTHTNLHIVHRIHSQYCVNFNGLERNAKKVLRNWAINQVPTKVLKVWLQRLLDVVAFMHTHSRIRTPIDNRTMQVSTDEQFCRSIASRNGAEEAEKTYENLIQNNNAIVNVVKMVEFLNYVNENREKANRVPRDAFYLHSLTVTQPSNSSDRTHSDLYEEYVRRMHERQRFPDYYQKIDRYSISFSKRLGFEELASNELEPPFDYKGTELFNFCQYPFLLDPKAKASLLLIEAKLSQQTHFREARQGLANIMLHAHQSGLHALFDQSRSPVFKLQVSRHQIVESTIANLSRATPADLKKPLTVSFHGEQARDAQANETAGVRREFFILILEALLSPQYGMFKYYEDSRCMWFSESCFEDPQIYRLVGQICGLALYNDNIVDIHFPLALYKKILGEKPDLSDLEELDPATGRSLRALQNATKEDRVEDWCLSFAIDVQTQFGENKTVELINGGTNLDVTYENRQGYIDKYVQYVFENPASERFFRDFKSGFLKVIQDTNTNIINIFSAVELMEIIVGDTSFNWMKLQEDAKYCGVYHKGHENIRRFWNVFHGLNIDNKRRFLLFLTGSSKIPISGLEIRFQPVNGGKNFLPAAHTCFNLLDLPFYSNEKELKEKLLYAIKNCKGFQLV